MVIKKLKNMRGFGHLEILVVIIICMGICVSGFFAYNRMQKRASGAQLTQPIQWQFNNQQNSWRVSSGTPPVCKNPYVFEYSPIEKSAITNVLLPGSYRGYSYKPHGGFGVNNEGNVNVRMPADATLVSLTRYYEGNQPVVQYMMTFETDCGIAFRFDHLYSLTPHLQTLANQTPEPKLNDSRTDPNQRFPRTKFKAGQVIATQVGIPAMKRYGFDFGVYDYRHQNSISRNPKWAAIHKNFISLEWYGVCWYGMLPGIAQTDLERLSLQQTDTNKTVKKASDYCSHTPYKTLDINNGLPTDG